MTDYLLAWLFCAIVFLAADLVWLGIVAKRFYRYHLGHLLADPFNGPVAFLFYAVYVVGVVVFAVSGAGGWQDAAGYGALFGFFCYATYNLTNLATLRDWPALVSIVDMAWGTAVTALTAGAGYALLSLAR